MLVDLSVILSILHIIVLFLFLFEYRCSRRTFHIAASAGMALLVAVNGGLLLAVGAAETCRLSLFTGFIPSLIFFHVLARDRGARFFFTFCLVYTVCMWVILLTGLVDHFAGGGGVVAFALRFLAFPLLEWVVWKYVRGAYHEILHSVRRGWGLFAVTTAVFYVLFTVISSYPTTLFDRPDDIPAALLVAVLMPLTYATIFRVCCRQMAAAEAGERQRVFQAQTGMIERRAQELQAAENRLRIERHDLRHRFQALAGMLARGENEAALAYIGASQERLAEAGSARCCRNAVLDAILSSYFELARGQGIRVEAQLAIPDELPVDVAELSTVFANALENAIRACGELPEARRVIQCKCVVTPTFMFEIANPYAGEVRFSPDGLPVSDAEGHGIGARSIVAFAEKYDAICRFRAEDGWFKVQVAL